MLIVWLVAAAASCALLKAIFYVVRRKGTERRHNILRELGLPVTKRVVAFFHPYCNAGGGGERVLWTAIALIQRTEPDVVSIVYSGDVDATKDEIIQKVKSRFDIELSPATLHFVFLRRRYLVEETTWPRFTLLGQSIGSVLLACEALGKCIPDLYIDTMGYAFTFQIAAMIGGIPVGAYVHYPTISTDMLARVQSRRRWHTNSDAISSSTVLSLGKLLYYRLFMYYYSHALRDASFLMANSSWTKNHIDAILQYREPLLDIYQYLSPGYYMDRVLKPRHPVPTSAQIVYPPCDTREMAAFALDGRAPVILSVAQFRPEKDHAAQLRAFHTFLERYPEFTGQARLVMVGGSRNAEDAARVDALRALAEELGIDQYVQIIVNAPYSEMLQWLSRASIGLSTMVDEHFGINIVEFMAAGAIPVTHASGGPLNDIVVPFNGEPTGFHATTPAEFADAFAAVLRMGAAEQRELRARARAWAVQRFSEEEFEKGWSASGWRKWLAQ